MKLRRPLGKKVYVTLTYAQSEKIRNLILDNVNPEKKKEFLKWDEIYARICDAQLETRKRGTHE